MNTKQQKTTKGDQYMNTHRQAAVFVGIMFIFATVFAILGLLFYQPILSDSDFLTNGAANSTQVIVGALMELTLVVSAIGTAIGLFPVLKPYGERIALGHLFFRFLEAIIITIGIMSVLSLLSLSQDFVSATAPDASAYRVSGTLLQAVYKTCFMLGPLFMLGINTLMYSSLLYKSKLVPRPLAVMGISGAILVFAYALLVIFGLAVQGSGFATVLALPIASYEMILAVWLITKGFNPAATASESVRTATNELLTLAQS